MLNFKTILLIAVLLIGVYSVGYSSEKDKELSFEDEFVIEKGYYQPYYFQLEESDLLDVLVETEGTPIDVYLLDSNNFNQLESNGTFEYYQFRGNSIKTQIKFEAPNYDTYYIVFESLNSDAKVKFNYTAYY
ncbi:protein of unknown function (DUF1883) [Methanolobus tindarius DSM 2278]|uniref:Peptidase C-terminal archaeal/bacterial domain-containing protein n=1 Tax=Methanolobus tindarius DSM 2278 TaxID=1090322 RepID=W9DPU9_METTI|nr:protein of unknown function (DUF1883) [Methanolobus tindarius DSM 2278]